MDIGELVAAYVRWVSLFQWLKECCERVMGVGFMMTASISWVTTSHWLRFAYGYRPIAGSYKYSAAVTLRVS
jgi:hypothetical protein